MTGVYIIRYLRYVAFCYYCIFANSLLVILLRCVTLSYAIITH